MVKYRLIYFNSKGRAEVARLLFAHAGVEYEDVRLTHEEWAEMKPNTPFGQLPILEVDGVQYCQSGAIANYLAREFNLAGKNNLEMLRNDMVGFCIDDILKKIPFMEKDEKKKAEGMKEAFTVHVPPLLKKLEAILGQSSSGYFSSELAAVDIAWMLISSFFKIMSPGALDCVPKLEALAKKVEGLPRISAWIEARPKTAM